MEDTSFDQRCTTFLYWQNYANIWRFYQIVDFLMHLNFEFDYIIITLEKINEWNN